MPTHLVEDNQVSEAEACANDPFFSSVVSLSLPGDLSCTSEFGLLFWIFCVHLWHVM